MKKYEIIFVEEKKAKFSASKLNVTPAGIWTTGKWGDLDEATFFFPMFSIKYIRVIKHG